MVSNVGLFAVDAAVFQKYAVLCTFRQSIDTRVDVDGNHSFSSCAVLDKKNSSVLMCRVRADTYIDDGSGKEILKPRIHFVCS